MGRAGSPGPAGAAVKDDTPFILECPSCHTRYEIPVAIPEDGRKVRCANCTHVWMAQPEDAVRLGEALASEAGDQAQEVIFREGRSDLEPQAAETEPGGEAADEAAQETAFGEAASPETIPEPEGAVPDEPQSFAAAVAEAEAEAAAGKDGGTQSGAAGEDGASQDEIDDIFADAVAGEAAGDEEFKADEPADDGETSRRAEDAASAAAAVLASAAPAGGDGERDEVAAFYDEPVEANPGPTPERVPPPPPVPPKPRPKRKGLPAGVGAGWAALLLAVAGLCALAVHQRAEVVKLMPGTARLFEAVGLPVNIRGLDFRGVAYSWETDGGQVVLEVHGDIVNITSGDLAVPPLVLALRDENETEVYHWEEEVMSEPLGAGDSATFAVRIPTPPKSIKSVQVRFARER